MKHQTLEPIRLVVDRIDETMTTMCVDRTIERKSSVRIGLVEPSVPGGTRNYLLVDLPAGSSGVFVGQMFELKPISS